MELKNFIDNKDIFLNFNISDASEMEGMRYSDYRISCDMCHSVHIFCMKLYDLCNIAYLSILLN